jgi:hypothetical protein
MSIPIVIVEDDKSQQYLARRIIKRAVPEAIITVFDAGDDFVAVVRDEARRKTEIGEPPPPILILLDINMPRMNGFEVLEALKDRLTEDDGLMVVAMFTSSNHAEDKAVSLAYSFVKDYIVKPLTDEKIRELVNRFCIEAKP